MIQSFADTETELLIGKTRRLPADILSRAIKRLTQLDAANAVDDLRLPLSNRLENLTGNLAGNWSIRINDQRRLCFRFANGDAFEEDQYLPGLKQHKRA